MNKLPQERWCVQHREGWCYTKSQPKREPRYREHVTTYCGYVVTAPWGFERRAADCPECRAKDAKR